MATTIDTEQVGRTTETMLRTAQQSAYTTMDYAAKAQEINAELLRKTAEVWIDGLQKQTDLTRQMTREVLEKAEDEVPQDFFERWGFFPFWWTPYAPLTFWREWAQAVQKTVTEQASNVNSSNRSRRR